MEDEHLPILSQVHGVVRHEALLDPMFASTKPTVENLV
jgi:hypothetical protein